MTRLNMLLRPERGNRTLFLNRSSENVQSLPLSRGAPAGACSDISRELLVVYHWVRSKMLELHGPPILDPIVKNLRGTFVPLKSDVVPLSAICANDELKAESPFNFCRSVGAWKALWSTVHSALLRCKFGDEVMSGSCGSRPGKRRQCFAAISEKTRLPGQSHRLSGANTIGEMHKIESLDAGDSTHWRMPHWCVF